MTIEVAMPVYRPSGRLEAVLTALALQTYRNFYVTIYNDTNPEETDEIRRDEEIVQRMQEKYGLDIRLVQNPENLGYMRNMRQIFDRVTGDILFLLADDDIISYDCMELLAKAFSDPEIGCVSRPYYWFSNEFTKAVRFSGHIGNEIIKVDLSDAPLWQVTDCMTEAGQLSGLGFRRSVLYDEGGFPFEEDMFTAHVYPFLYAFKQSKCALMSYPTVAVCSSTSQCQNDIYDPSPSYSWIKLYEILLPEERYQKRREEIIEKTITTDFLGLAEIKNYGTFKELRKEIAIYAKCRKKNLINPKFYVYAIGSIMIPKALLKKMVAWYKDKVLSKRIESLHIDYSRFPFEEIRGMWKFSGENERTKE